MIRSFSTVQFRNLEDAEVEIDAPWCLLVGDNGAGKTSVLEALYLAATSKSFLTHRLIDCVRGDGESFAIAAECDNEQEGRHRMRLTWGRQEGLERRINDSRSDLLSYVEVQPVVAYTARDGDLLDGAPASRRRFLDSNMVNQRPVALKLLARLRRVLEAKRAALSRGQPVEPWNELLAPLAIQVQRERDILIDDLQRRSADLIETIGLGGRNAKLEYLPSSPCADEAVDSEQLLRDLNRRADEERDCGYPLWGPQRDDWSWSWEQGEMRRRASRGEKKVLTLALFTCCCQRLLEHDRGVTMLVDDLDSDLDRERRRKVCETLATLPQVIATSSQEEGWHGGSQIPTHGIRNGCLSRL